MDYQCPSSNGWNASVGRRESLDAVEAYLATDESCNYELFGTPKIQQPTESRNATDSQGDALETLSTEDLKQDPEPEVSVSDEDGEGYVAAESHEEIVDEMLHQSLMKNHTRSKSRKVVVPAPLLLSDSEDEEHRPQPSKRNRASPAPLRAGGKAKYVRRGSNQFPVMSSKTFAARKAKARGRGRKRPTHDCASGDDTPLTTTLSSFFASH